MHLEKGTSLVLLLVGAVFLLAAGLFQGEDIGGCGNLISGTPATCNMYIPGTNILIEPTVRVLIILSYFAFGTGVMMFLTSRINDRKNPASITPTPVK